MTSHSCISCNCGPHGCPSCKCPPPKTALEIQQDAWLDAGLCINGQDSKECREIDPCEMCWQDWSENDY